MNPRETNLKIIKDAVAKVSDTMELKWGCVILAGKSRRRLTIINSKIREESHSPRYRGLRNHRYFRVKNERTELAERDIVKILGREAQLADVLIALNEKLGDDVYAVGMHGCTHKPEGQKLLHDWNLSVGIEHQTDETVLFIAELLK